MDEAKVRRELAGSCILVVEDEALVALNLESMLEDLGCRVLGPVMRLDHIDRAIAAGPPVDAAILDVNIAGVEIFPHAERLVAAGLPVVFATGYGRSGVPEAWRDRPIVQKPYTADEIERALGLALSRPDDAAAAPAPAKRQGD